MDLRLLDEETGNVLAEKIETADSFWSRLRGLMFRREFEKGEALLFGFSKPKKFRIHTFFVFFPIDLIYLNEEFEVLEIEEGLPPWRVYNPSVEASYLVELPAGEIEQFGVEGGDELKIRD